MASLDEAMQAIRSNTMTNVDPAILAVLEQLYTSWRNTMTEAGVTIDENAIRAVMVSMSMMGDEDWGFLSQKFGLSPDWLMMSMLAVSIDPRELDLP